MIGELVHPIALEPQQRITLREVWYCLDSSHDCKLISLRRVGWPNRWHWPDYQNLVKLQQQNMRQQMTTASEVDELA